MKPRWEKKSVTVDQPIISSDDEGNTIVYHYLETTHYDNEPIESTGVDIDIVGLVVDVSEAGSIRDCMVSDIPAILYVKNDRACLCWTLSPKYSFAIEYTPSAVMEEEIFRKAKSVCLS